MTIINLTQHSATAEQIAAGVVDMNGEEKQELNRLLTFNDRPTREDIQSRCAELVHLACHSVAWAPSLQAPNQSTVMIGGAMWLMGPLSQWLHDNGMRPVFAFSRRESVEVATADGVQKTSVFKHVGFVDAVVIEQGKGSGAKDRGQEEGE